jgi:large subunit ribosomal protein L22
LRFALGERRNPAALEAACIMEYKAIHRYADMSARKIRPFAQLIRGRPADEALELLRYLPNKSARLVEQVVKSALGNAEDKGARNLDDLVVLESRVDGGPIMKRIMPRARGTAYPIKRRYSHIHVILSDLEPVVE